MKTNTEKEIEKTREKITDIVDYYQNLDEVDNWEEMDKRIDTAILEYLTSYKSQLREKIESMPIHYRADRVEVFDVSDVFQLLEGVKE